MPTTSMAGDCVRAVIACVEVGFVDSNFVAGKVCMRALILFRRSIDGLKEKESYFE